MALIMALLYKIYLRNICDIVKVDAFCNNTHLFLSPFYAFKAVAEMSYIVAGY